MDAWKFVQYWREGVVLYLFVEVVEYVVEYYVVAVLVLRLREEHSVLVILLICNVF